MVRRIFLLALTCALPLRPEEKIDWEMNAKIRQEGMKNSQILRSMHFLTDVYGPRLTGSPNLKSAQEWALSQMKEWGLENGHLEPWDFGHPGWLNERFAMFIVSPVKDSLVGEVLAWTPGTNGVLTAEAVILQLPDRPTPEKLTAFIAENKPSMIRNAVAHAHLVRSQRLGSRNRMTLPEGRLLSGICQVCSSCQSNMYTLGRVSIGSSWLFSHPRVAKQFDP